MIDLINEGQLNFLVTLMDKVDSVSLLNGFHLQRPELFSWEGILVSGFYFTVYAFFGWLLENTYSLFTRSVFFKDGFFWGPFKPMYGIAPLLLIFFINHEMSGLFILLSCFFIPTFVEYVSGTLLQKFFHRQWWDYSQHRWQLHGHICLSFSLCWLVLSVFGLKFLHPMIETMYGKLAQSWLFLFPIIATYFIIELFLAIRRHRVNGLSFVKSTNSLR